MKLKNKKTGEIVEVAYGRLLMNFENGEVEKVKSLAELNEEYEDYEEPKEHWIINSMSGIEKTDRDEEDEPGRAMIEIGNYFETREEAEKAVEKLKAWKRLKDKGVRFGKRSHGHYGGEMFWECPNGSGVRDKQIWLDLDLLFGGEK